MPDFREKLYNQYVSKFKGTDSKLSNDPRSSYFRWCQYKFLPLLDGVGPDSAILEL